MDSKPIRILLIGDTSSARSAAALLNSDSPGDPFLSTIHLSCLRQLREGLRCLAEAAFDVILATLTLPDSQGPDTVLRLRQAAPETPLIVLSSHTEQALAIQAVREGAHDYLDQSHLDRHSLFRSIRYAVEHKRAAERRQRSEALNQAILNSLSAPIALLDAHGTILIANAAWRRLAHAASSPALIGAGPGLNYLAVCRAAAAAGNETAQAALAGLQAVLSGAQAQFTLEYPHSSPEERHWFCMQVTRLADGAGFRHTVIVHEEVTARRAAEDLAQKNERRFRALIENSTDAIALLDGTGRILFQSPAVTRILGYSVQDLLGRNAFDLLHPDDVASSTRLFAQLLEHADEPVTSQLRYRRKDGTWCWLEATGSNLLNEPSTRAIVVNYRDITEHKQTEKAILRQADELTVLYAIAVASTQAPTLDHLLERATEIVGATLYPSNFGILLLDASGRQLIVHPSYRGLPSAFRQNPVIPLGHGITGQVAASGQARRIADVTGEPGYIEFQSEARSELCVPLKAGARVLGVINAESPQFDAFSEADERLLLTSAGQLAGAIEKAQLFDALRNSERKHRLLVEQLPAITYEITLGQRSNASNRTTYISPQLETILGFTPDEWLSDPLLWIAQIHPNDRDWVLAEVSAKNARAEALDIEYRVLGRGGQVVWFRNRYNVVAGEDNQPAYIHGLMLDVTQRKQVEEALVASEKRFRALIEHSTDAIALFDVQGTILYASPSTTRILGYALEDYVGRNGFDFLYPDDIEPASQALAKLVHHPDGVVRLEYRLRHQDGSWRWMEGVGHNLLHEPSVGAIVGNYRDITERKQAEEALRQSEARYRAMVEDQTELITRFLPDGTLTFANEAYCHYFRAPREISLGQPIQLSAGVSDQSFSQLVAAVSPARPVTTAEMQVEAPNNELRWLHWSLHALFDSQGRLIEFQGTGRDITERKQRERELQASATVSTALRAAPGRAAMLPIILDHLLDLVKGDRSALVMRDPATGELVTELLRGQPASRAETRSAEDMSSQVIATGQPCFTNDPGRDPLVSQPELSGHRPGMACAPLIAQGETIGALWVRRPGQLTLSDIRVLTVIADIAANAIRRATWHEETRRRVERLQALRTIDAAITASLDLRVTLNILLDQATRQLGVDAASVLAFRPHTQTLEYAASRGFRTRAIEHIRLHVGDSLAGRAVLKRGPVHIANLTDAVHRVKRMDWLEQESLVVYYGTPLIAKGNVKGVLELFHHQPLPAEPEWVEFVETLAGQAAIAIDNITLFNELQRSNSELSLAYDTTLEGWSRALDLRDEETEGHTRRVTELSHRLGRGNQPR